MGDGGLSACVDGCLRSDSSALDEVGVSARGGEQAVSGLASASVWLMPSRPHLLLPRSKRPPLRPALLLFKDKTAALASPHTCCFPLRLMQPPPTCVSELYELFSSFFF